MASSIFRIVFNAFTAPGVLVSNAIQEAADERYGVPYGRLAVWGKLDRDAVVENRNSLSQVARVLGPNEEPREGEHVKQFVDYEALDEYQDMFAAVLGPFFAMTGIAMLLFAVFSVLRITGVVNNSVLLWWAGVYPGFAAAVHALPKPGATIALWTRTEGLTGVASAVFVPIVGTAYVLNGARVIWVSLFYAFFLFWLVSTLFGLPL